MIKKVWLLTTLYWVVFHYNNGFREIPVGNFIHTSVTIFWMSPFLILYTYRSFLLLAKFWTSWDQHSGQSISVFLRVL